MFWTGKIICLLLRGDICSAWPALLAPYSVNMQCPEWIIKKMQGCAWLLMFVDAAQYARNERLGFLLIWVSCVAIPTFICLRFSLHLCKFTCMALPTSSLAFVQATFNLHGSPAAPSSPKVQVASCVGWAQPDPTEARRDRSTHDHPIPRVVTRPEGGIPPLPKAPSHPPSHPQAHCTVPSSKWATKQARKQSISCVNNK